MVDKSNDVSVIIKTYAEDANKSLSTLITNLNTLNTNINKINTSLNRTKTNSKTTKKEIKNVETNIQKLSVASANAQKNINKMFDVGKLYLYWNVTKRIRDTLKSLINSSIDYIETQNLFDVSMGSQSENAYKFMNTMANTFGMARTELMNYQASFNNVLKSLPGLADETSYALSETLMKMAGDYASLFNFTLPKAMEKFQSALTGSVKPIRDKTGLDITEKTIQGVATNLGVEKTVGQLNQVEKRLLRIIALQDQLGEVGAMGDFAKTLESPSNQLKVLQQQLQELGVWLGNVFIGTIGKILPYINGFVMALVAIAKALAIFVGYQETKYDDPLQIEDTTGSVDDLTSSLGGAVSKAKELKKILMGFDVLNVITTPSEDSGGGGGSVTSIDPAILNALKDYDNLMSGVEMKATKIRDRIMEWLGFEKIINEETGEINWQLKDGKTNLEKIIEILKLVGITLLGTFIVKKVISLINFLKEIHSILKIISGFKIFQEIGFAISAVAGKAATVGEAIKYLFAPIITFFGKIKFAISAVVGGAATLKEAVMYVIGPVGTALSGIFSVISGIILAFKNFFDMFKNGFSVVKEILMVLGTAIAAVGAVLLGAPALVAAIVAAVVSLLSTVVILVKDNWESIKTFFGNLGLKIKEIFTNITNWIYEKVIIPVSQFFVNLWNTLVNIFSKTALWVDKNVIQPVLSVIIPIVNKIKEIVNTIWQIITAVFGFVSNWINQNVVQPILIKFTEMFEKINNVITQKIQNIKTFFTNVWENIKNLFSIISNSVVNSVNSIWNTITSVFGKIANWIYVNVVNPVKNFFIGAWQIVGNTISGIIRGAVNAALTGVENVINFFIRGLNNVVSVVNNLPGVNIGYISQLYLPRFAEGGFPDVGEMFIAREAGPELVGKIGNSSAVVNNQQIVESVSRGVAQAVSQVMNKQQGGSYKFYLDGKEMTSVITKIQNRNLSVMGV